MADEREREEMRPERGREEARRGYGDGEGFYGRGGFDWVSFLLGLLLGIVALGVIWFFTESDRREAETPPTQIIFEDRRWDADDTANVDDAGMRRIGSANGVNVYVQRDQSPPYTVIYVRQNDNVYRSYSPTDQTEQPTDGDQEPEEPSEEEQAREIADQLPTQVAIGQYTWTRGDLVKADAVGALERYDNITVNNRQVYRPAGEQDPEQVYVNVGTDMCVRYNRMAR